MHGNMMLSNSIASNKITCMVRFPKGPRFESQLFFNVVNFHFRLTELGISGMGMKISLKSVKIWLRYEGLKLTEPTPCNRANYMYGQVSQGSPVRIPNFFSML